MALNMCGMRSNGIEIHSLFLSKNFPASRGEAPRTPKAPEAGGFAPTPPSVIRLSCTTLFNTSPSLDIFILKFRKPDHGFWSSILRYLCPTKFLFQKFLMTLMHVICDLPPPPKSKILASPMRQQGHLKSATPTKAILKQYAGKLSMA